MYMRFCCIYYNFCDCYYNLLPIQHIFNVFLFQFLKNQLNNFKNLKQRKFDSLKKY